MTVYLARGCSAAFLVSMAVQPAFAEVTAKEVWSDWKDYISSAGYQVTATENMSGDTLNIDDLSMSIQIPETDGQVRMDIEQMSFKENGDGTVSVALPASMPMSFNGVGEDDKKIDLVITYSHSGSAIVVSGSPGDMLYNYTAAKADIDLSSLSIDGETIGQDAARLNLSLANVSTSTQMKVADMRAMSQRMNADSVTYDFAFNDPESDDQGAFNGSIQNIGFEGTGTLPLEMNTADFRSMLDAGFAFSGTFTFGSGNSSIQGSGDGEQFSAQTSSQGGALGVSMDSSSISYDASQKQSEITITSGELPFPVSINMALASFKLAMPVGKSDQEQDFGFAFSLGDFTMSDMIWAMFDPQNALPRDPATIALDLSGKAKVLFDFLDPEVATMLEESDQPPGELNALTINKLLVSMVGARISGAGDFTFDNSDLETFDGMPRPIGAVDLEIVGANGLIDKLIAMGFVSDQDAMGARMMLGMLAVPGQGEDTLTSKIEINEQGHILANGQRLQ